MDVVHDAMALEEKDGPEAALAWAFGQAKGLEIDALDLLLARHWRDDDALWLWAVNRYLQPHGQTVRLESATGADRFARICTVDHGQKVLSDDLVSVFMPVHQAERTLRHAAESILAQTWRNLELILVDDGSTDGSWALCQSLAEQDKRVRIHRSPRNVGPYVSKNLALRIARGRYITCHDADDWALPDRIAHQVSILRATGAKATSGRMLRLGRDGEPTRPTRLSALSDDGFVRRCFVSLMVERVHFDAHLGAWDSVRVGADSELMERAQRAPGGVRDDPRILMLCLDRDDGLTRHPVLGIGVFRADGPRATYQRLWRRWHCESASDLRLPLLPAGRPFPVPPEMQVDAASLKVVHESLGPLASEAVRQPLSAAAADQPSTPAEPANGKPPGPGSALYLAFQLSQTQGHERAIQFAERYLSPELRHTTQILQANAAIDRGDEGAWTAHLNRYLQRHALSPVRLEDGQGLLARLSTDPLPKIDEGPLVTVIMPAWNAQGTVRHAARSVLNQTWRNIELIVVDDASTDRTWDVLKELAAEDGRVRIRRNKVNVGPYVSKNVGLSLAKGTFVTGHDADDWAHPQRIERHVQELLASKGNVRASLTYMIRVTPTGQFRHIGKIGPFSFDGVARKASISCLFHREDLQNILGYWDSVRFAADSEMIARAEAVLGKKFGISRQIGMICLDLETSLTNDPVHGIRSNAGGLSDSRLNYRNSWQHWHKANLPTEPAYLDFPLKQRRYEAAPEMVIAHADQLLNLD